MSPQEDVDNSIGWLFIERFLFRFIAGLAPFFVIVFGFEGSSGNHLLVLLLLGELVSLSFCLVFDGIFRKLRQWFWKRHPLRGEEGINGDFPEWYLWIQPIVWVGFLVHAFVFNDDAFALTDYAKFLLVAGFLECGLRVNSIWVFDNTGSIRRLWVSAIGVLERGNVPLKSMYMNRTILYDQSANNPLLDSGTELGTLVGLTVTLRAPEIGLQKEFVYGPRFIPHKYGRPDSAVADMLLENMIESSEKFHALGIPYHRE